jgi:hypothetical protein
LRFFEGGDPKPLVSLAARYHACLPNTVGKADLLKVRIEDEVVAIGAKDGF